jgi:hypothetical protein
VLDPGRPLSRRRGCGGGYVDEIGAADPQPADLPLTSEERSAHVGSSHLTDDVRASFQILERRERIGFQYGDRAPRDLLHQGDWGIASGTSKLTRWPRDGPM